MTENKKLLQLTLSFPFGDHSNRLFQNLHFEAFCKEHSVNYVNPSFENLQSFYVNPCAITSKKKSFLSTHPKLLLKLNKLNLLSNVILFDEESPANENILLETSNENTFVGGWGFRTHSLTEKYQDDFSERYTLKANFYENNELFKIFSQKRNEGFIIAGIHIRRGDYKFWKEGRFYFEDHVFLNSMKQLQKEVKENLSKEVFFVIFSNEKITITESDNVIFSKNEWYIDQFLMSICDFLIGPPSTFTLWASYVGKTKYFHLNSPNQKITLNDFKYCLG